MKEGFVICVNSYIDVRAEVSPGEEVKPGAYSAPKLYQRLKIEDTRFFGNVVFYSFERYNVPGCTFWFCSDAFRLVATVKVINQSTAFHGVRKLYYDN